MAMVQSPYKELEDKIGITFIDRSLLELAFVHRSFLNENPRNESNERLEFLGDAVLELATTDYLYRTFIGMGEGELTNYRAALVKGKHLAHVAQKLDLGKYLFLSKGEERSGGREKNYILANTTESLIGAIYLDQGFAVTHKFIDNFILANLGDILKRGLHIDAKTKLQEVLQEKMGITPLYDLLAEDGPDHNRLYTMGIYVNKKLVAQGQGSSKQKAEQSAAANALEKGDSLS